MAEWSIAAVLKTAIPWKRDRGFESHSLLQFNSKILRLIFYLKLTLFPEEVEPEILRQERSLVDS